MDGFCCCGLLPKYSLSKYQSQLNCSQPKQDKKYHEDNNNSFIFIWIAIYKFSNPFIQTFHTNVIIDYYYYFLWFMVHVTNKTLILIKKKRNSSWKWVKCKDIIFWFTKLCWLLNENRTQSQSLFSAVELPKFHSSTVAKFSSLFEMKCKELESSAWYVVCCYDYDDK